MTAIRDALGAVTSFAAFPVLVAIGIIVAIALAAMGRWRDGLSTGLELWVAAGLLRLALASTWTAIAVATAIIVIRRTVVWSINRSETAKAA